MTPAIIFVIVAWVRKWQDQTAWNPRKSSLTISEKPVGVGAVSQRLIPTSERSGLQTRIAATESGRERMGAYPAAFQFRLNAHSGTVVTY